jgi:hypothetical protein
MCVCVCVCDPVVDHAVILRFGLLVDFLMDLETVKAEKQIVKLFRGVNLELSWPSVLQASVRPILKTSILAC